MHVSGLKRASLFRDAADRGLDGRINGIFNNGPRLLAVLNAPDEKSGLRMRVDFCFLNRPIEECKYALERIRIRRCRVFESRCLQRASTSPRFVIAASG